MCKRRCHFLLSRRRGALGRRGGGREGDVMSAALHTGRPRRRSHAESLVRPDIVVDVDGPAYHAFHLGEIHAVAVEEPPVLYGVVHPLGQCVVQRVARLRGRKGCAGSKAPPMCTGCQARAPLTCVYSNLACLCQDNRRGRTPRGGGSR